MKAYKFRDIQNFDRVLDILRNRRLYCSPVRHLNDIREADIRTGDDRGKEREIFEFGLNVTAALDSYRVCSLCKTFDNHLLWAHYAAGSTGLAIEVDLPDDDISEVSYTDDFMFLSEYIDSGVESAIRAALAKKAKCWEYEQEVRLIARSEYYNLTNPIIRVVIGPRISLSTIKTLAAICSSETIGFERAVVADWGMYTTGVQEQ